MNRHARDVHIRPRTRTKHRVTQLPRRVLHRQLNWRCRSSECSMPNMPTTANISSMLLVLQPLGWSQSAQAEFCSTGYVCARRNSRWNQGFGFRGQCRSSRAKQCSMRKVRQHPFLSRPFTALCIRINRSMLRLCIRCPVCHS